LERLVRSGKTEQRVAFRSRIVLQAAKGWSNSAIAEALGTSRPTVIDWRKRYEAEGIAGLSHDRPRGRSFQPIARDKEAEVIEKTLHSTPQGPPIGAAAAWAGPDASARLPCSASGMRTA
jgi:hypothetical protein